MDYNTLKHRVCQYLLQKNLNFFPTRSVIPDRHALAHFFQALRQPVDQLELRAERQRQPRILVRRVHRAADEKVNIRGAINQFARNQ